MPTKKVTCFVCLMLTAAMLMSSLGVGLISAPAEAVFEMPAYDGTAADDADITEETDSTIPGKYIPTEAQDDTDDTLSTYGGWNSEPNASPWGDWSFRNAQNVPGAEALGYTGDGVVVAVADTGIDFGAQNLAGKYITDSTTLTLTNHTVVAGSVRNQNNVSLPNTNIVAGTLEIKLNGTVTTAYTADLVRGEVLFNSVLPLGSTVICAYQYRPYYGWPVAFDALGLPQYLLAKEARTGGGGVANTSLNGTGPFDIDHTVRMDGQNDYTVTESACPDDRYGDVLVNGTAEGVEFDMTELWGTRDKDFWYAGIQTRYAAMNRTFGFAMDFDGGASGAVNDPHGNLLDFEASHSAAIEQAAYNLNLNLLATCAGGSVGNSLTDSYESNSVKIWGPTGNLVRTLPTEETVVDSVVWSPTGNRLAYVTGIETVVYDTATWTEEHRVQHSSGSEKVAYFRESLAFSPNGTMLITGSVAISNRIFVLNLNTAETSEPLVNSRAGSIAYNPAFGMIALGLDNGGVQIIDSTTYADIMMLKTKINPIVEDSKPIETLAWSPDGMHLATGRQAGGYINIWNITGNMTWAVNDFNLTGHGDYSSVNSILWPAADSIISGCEDGTVIYWNPFTSPLPATTRNSRYNTPVRSLALSPSNEIFVGTSDCTVRKYPSDWSAYTAFSSHRPDIMVYIRYEREYYNYSTGQQKLDIEDKIEEPDVYKWNTATMSWTKTNMTNIWGNSIYKGVSAGEWTAKGFIEIALPRNFTAWPDQNTMYLSAFVCGDNSSRPQDTVPADYNVPSPSPPTYVNWQGTDKVTLSAWGVLDIPKTTVVGIPSATGTYHFGYHPSAALTNIFGLVPIVVTESTTAGVWDRVYVDMNNDYVIDSNDPYVNKAGPVLAVDIWDATTVPVTPGADGVPDLSGGMLYFIGDGKTKMPYSDRMSDVLMASGDQLTPFNVDNPMPIPRNGEIIAFFGDFNYDDTDGMISHGTQTASAIAGSGLNEGVCAPVKGVSPDVMFLPICNANYGLDYALYFAVEGYDGKVNTGDEAQVVSIGQYTSGYGSGFDEISYLVEFLVNATQSHAVFISPAGNDGSGYGTVAAPCSLNTLVVGYTEDNTYRTTSTDEVQHYMTISEASSRGPTAAGLAKPDLVAVGVGEVDLPLGASGVLQTSVGGKSQTTLWTGSDLAAAVASGTMALIFEAYKQKTGAFPNTQTALSIIKSSAQDLGYDPLTQGSGFIDALAAVRLAAGTSGLSASAPKTAFGNTFGVDYSSFINVLDVGDSDTIPVSLMNPTSGTLTPNYQVEYLQRIDIDEVWTVVSNTLGYKARIDGMIPANAEVVKITAQTSYVDFLDKSGSFFMTLWDWDDRSHDGAIDDVELNYLTSVEYGYLNSMTCTFANPHGGVNGTLVIDITPDAGSGSTLPSRDWRITVESFATVQWNWTTLSKTTSSLGPGASDTVNVQATVPAYAQSGTYQAAFVSSYAPTSVTWNREIAGTAPVESTSWDDGAQGNYWDDWTSPDTDPTDGIVDDPFSIQPLGNLDNYPLVDPADTYTEALILAAPIMVTDNSEFASVAARGDGTAGNPWVIENLDIDGSTYSQDGIYISGTTDYFIIRNCNIHDSPANSGIYMSNIHNSAILDCEIYNHPAGDAISILDNSQNILIKDCLFHDNGNYGINAQYTTYMSLDSNVISQHMGGGIYFENCDDNIIAGNEIHGNEVSSVEVYGNNNNITGNYLHDEHIGLIIMDAGSGADGNEISWNLFANYTPDWTGAYSPGNFTIWMDTTSNSAVYNNDFINCDGGVGDVYIVDASGTSDWDGNYWFDDPNHDGTAFTAIDSDYDGVADLDDNSPLAAQVAQTRAYQKERGVISIPSDADFTLANGVVNPSAAGTALDPFIISGWDIDTTGFGHGIKIENTTVYFVVMDCIVHGNVAGYGVTLFNAPNGIVRSNGFTNLGTGVSVWFTSMSAVYMNAMTGLDCGVYIQSCDNCSASYNTVTGGETGIRITGSEFCTVEMNLLDSNTDDGIMLDHSADCSLTYNNASSNGYGIHLENSTGINAVHHNNIISNANQAYDDFASFAYDEFAPTIISLPNTRLTDGAVTLYLNVTKLDNSVETKTVTYTVHRKAGTIELGSTFLIERGLNITVKYTYYNACLIPITLSVLASEVANVNYGDLNANETALGIGIMPTWGVRPGQGAIKDSGDRLVSGDRRYFYVHVPNQGMFSISELINFYLYNELNWDLMFTDLNIVVYGKGDTSDYPTAAPYTLNKLGGSEEKPDFSFFTATGGPTDILVTPFNHEVLTICVSAKSFNGNGPSLTKFEGNSGWLRLSDKNPKEWTNDVVGHTSISFQSSLDMPGLTASIVGPAQGTTSVEEIEADDLTLYDLTTLEGWLTMNAVAGFTKVVHVENALSWDVHIMGHPMCLDLDLALFKDGLNGEPEDGVAQWKEIITTKDMEFDAYKDNYGSGSYCYCADADADEAIKIISPPDGDYIIKVLGFTLTSEPGYFDLEIKSIFAGVEGYKLSHQNTEFEDEDGTDGGYLSTQPLESYDKRTFDILWTFPEGTEDNVYGGIFVLGIPSSPQMIVIAMDIILDREAPDILPGFTGPDTIVSNSMPTISAKIEDLAKGEIDPYGASVKFDGNDVTNIASISIMNTENSAEVPGYWTGDIIYKPASPLSEGNHHFDVEAKDKTGNARRLSWSFTVDTTEPTLVLDVPEDVYTSESLYRLTGRTEADSQISVIGVPAAINVRTDYTFDIDLELESGENYVAVKSTDLAGNVHEILEIITLDSETPVFTRVVALDGSTTNVRTTGIYGEMSETGTLTLNGMDVQVTSDGTFRYDTISLTEGQNMQVLEFTDLAGHVAHHYMNITLDTVAPTLAVDDIDSIVNSEWLNITGTTESTVTSLTVNGKLVDVSSLDGSFQNNIRISPGVNSIVVESKDRAGNSAIEVVTVVYEEDAGANYMAISLMVILLVIGLIIGLLVAPMFLGHKEEEPTPEEGTGEMPVEAMPGEAVEPAAEEPVEPVPEFEGEEPMESEEAVEAAEETEELEPIPAEESAPEALPDEKAALEAPEPEPEDPRIAKLTEAYESGKISKELYEKNLARFRGQQ